MILEYEEVNAFLEFWVGFLKQLSFHGLSHRFGLKPSTWRPRREKHQAPPCRWYLDLWRLAGHHDSSRTPIISWKALGHDWLIQASESLILNFMSPFVALGVLILNSVFECLWHLEFLCSYHCWLRFGLCFFYSSCGCWSNPHTCWFLWFICSFLLCCIPVTCDTICVDMWSPHCPSPCELVILIMW